MTTQHAVVSQFVQVVVSRAYATDGEMALREISAKLKPERVQEWLTANPEWRLGAGETVLHRTRSLPTGEAAMHFASFVSGLAASMALPAILEIRGGTVQVTLFSPRGRRHAPLTENVLALAGEIG